MGKPGRLNGVSRGNGQPCTAKAKHLAATTRLHKAERTQASQADTADARQVRQALMLAARAHAPADPNARDKLALLLGPGDVAQAEAAIFDHHPHLKPGRDAPWVASMAYLNVTLARVWPWFTGKARIAHATQAGKIHWNAGLMMLLRVEELRRRLGAEMGLTPAGRKALGLPVDPVDEAVDVVAQARALAKRQAAEWAADGNGDGDGKRD